MFFEFLKSILLGEIKKKYTTTSNVRTQNTTTNDKNEFDKLMSTYFNNPEELKQLNDKIDNDTTIEKNIFKKQVINNYSDYKNDIITYTENNHYTVNTFYGFLRQF